MLRKRERCFSFFCLSFFYPIGLNCRNYDQSNAITLTGKDQRLSLNNKDASQSVSISNRTASSKFAACWINPGFVSLRNNHERSKHMFMSGTGKTPARSILLYLIGVFLLSLSVTVAIQAQTSTAGSISGTVRDQKGAAVPNAPVVVKEEQTGLSRTVRSEEHTSELQSRPHLVCRLLLEKKKKKINMLFTYKKKKKKKKQ